MLDNSTVTRVTDNSYPPVRVTLTMSEWEQAAKTLFRWRARAGYATWHGRIQALGSSDYDKLVQFAARRA